MPEKLRWMAAFLVAAAVAACAEGGSGLATPPTTALPTSVADATTVPEAAEVVRVPAGALATIDGVLGPDEWSGALGFPMSDGAVLRLMHDEETLYLAVEGDEVGSVNVVVAAGGAVWVLHSSAALGSALYQPGAEEWELSHSFSWCCRNRRDPTERLALLEEEGWQANIGFTGDPGIVEYQIGLPWSGAALAVSSIRDDADRGFWPVGLSSEEQGQLVGSPPDTRSYATEAWPIIMAAGG